LITTLAETEEIQPAEFVTVKAYVPANKSDTVLDAPVPAIAPGLIVQFPKGNPLNTTLPVASAHVGWVIAPTIGAAGVSGCIMITTLADAKEVQPTEFVTV